MSEPWHKKYFKIALDPDGETTMVYGIASGPFGIYWDGSKATYSWSVTHLASGWNCGYFKDQTQAKRYAEEIALLTDWESVTPADRTRIEALCREIYERFPGHHPLTAAEPPAGRGDGGDDV